VHAEEFSPLMDRLVPFVHAGAALAMVGLIWTIQVVHYPLFRHVGAEGFVSYHERHTSRIGAALALFAPLEAITALVLLAQRPAGVPAWMPAAGIVLLAVIWLATVVFSVPAHMTLSGGFDGETIDRLVATNWIRTITWSARGVLALVMLWWMT
jgi:hypothetical protein